MTNLKIAIIGSQGTGKSTLSKVLAEETNIPLITEVARVFKKEQLHKSNPEYLSIQKEIHRLQIQEESLHNKFISDRSTIDNLAYYLYGCYDTASNLDNSAYIIESLHNASKYTHIFLLRPEFEIVCDNFRDTDIKYQYDVDTIIKCILQLYNFKYYTLSGTLENRLQKALEILSE